MSCGTCQDKPVRMKDFSSKNLFTWCTNCGNYGINAAIKRALVQECIKPKDTLHCFDIGCNGNGSDKIGGYSFHGLHGRIIPFACGASLANSRLTVIAYGGDGGTLGEGVGHLVHGIRGNYNITFVLHNNLNYGLTKGQASSTSKKTMKLDSSPFGTTSELLHPLRFVLSLESTFVARTFSGNMQHMTDIFSQAIHHNGFSFIEVLQDCPTYNKETTHDWYQERVFDITTVNKYDPSDRAQALFYAEDITEHIALGVLYRDDQSVPQQLRQQNRLSLTTELVDEVQTQDIAPLLAAFR